MDKDFIKITNAAYKILDFLPEADPLKYKAKEKALAILENLTLIYNRAGWISLKDYFSPEKGKAVIKILNDIEVLENYLKIGRYQGWIDNVNFLIITKEYDKIKGEIETKKFKISENLKSALIENRLLAINDKRELIAKNSSAEASENYSEITNQSSYKISARQGKILQILAEKKKAQVSDIIKELPNITKRTIRRDLNDLLKKDRVIRMGEFNQVFYQNKVILDRKVSLSQ